MTLWYRFVGGRRLEMSAPNIMSVCRISCDISYAALMKKYPNSACTTIGFAPSHNMRSTSAAVASAGKLARILSTATLESRSRILRLAFATAIWSLVSRLWKIETSELATVGEYDIDAFVVEELCVAYCAVTPEHQLLVFFRRDSCATSVRLVETPSSV